VETKRNAGRKGMGKISFEEEREFGFYPNFN